jgi:competence protein ComGC
MDVRKLGNRSSLVIAGGIITLLLIISGVLFYNYTKLKHNSAGSGEAAATRVISEVNKLYQAPTDETPVVEQVQDKSQLADQQFFAKAAAKDYVLLYKKNKLAVVYRESTNKLINVGPINFTDSSQPPANP